MMYQFGNMKIPETDRSQSPGDVLKHARKAKKLSQEQVAKALGCGQPQVFRLENDDREMTVAWAKKLAPILGIPAMKLLMPGEFTEVEEEYFELISSLTGDERKRAIGILRAFSRSDPKSPS